ncbi:Canalicular multispecific organic anion transporter 1, partial [Entomortierella chlamydospora]
MIRTLNRREEPFRKKIDVLRANELKALKTLATIRSILTIVFSSVTLLMGLFTFWTYAYYGGPNMTPGKLNSEIIFVSIALFGIMNKPLGMITHTFSTAIATNVAMKRIQKFLLMEEIDPTVVCRYSRQSHLSIPGGNYKELLAVDIENGTFMWEKPADSVIQHTDAAMDGERQPLLATSASQPAKPILSDITLHIPEGNLTAIVGRIGQGKSSLLSAIMGEMYKDPEGSVKVYGDLAYVPQQAWIINATVRDNIIFGKPFDQAKYDHIIYAAGLRPDLEMLVAGDQTEIGERGINLSGGQKQRVSLARAAYQDADIYLLDDPLSAVDAHVDQHLWKHLIGPDGLLKDKTRILVTHGIHHLEHVDQIVVLKDGSISEEGGYDKLMKAHDAFYQLIKEYSIGQKKHSSTKQRIHDMLHGKKDKQEHSEGSCSPKTGNNSDSEGDGSERDTIIGEGDASSAKDSQSGNDNSGELITEEKMEFGRVGWDVVLIYARAVSYPYALICIFLFVLSQACHIGTNFWLRYWIFDTESREKNGYEPRPTSYYLIGYGELVILFMCLDIIVNYTSEVICGLRASKVIYDRLLTRILRMPMSFFDTTPMGRIVNRFSSDIDAIDTRLPEEWNDLFAFISIIGGTLLVIAYSTPIFLVAIPPLLLTYFWVQHYFIMSSSSLKRLSSTSRSPLYQHFSETLVGVSSIRAMKGLREQFIKQNEARADIIINRYHAYNLDNRWLQVRLETLGGITVFLASSLAVWNAGELDPSLVGLALSYALNMTGFITYLVRTVNAVQNLLVSVERVDEYSQKPVEAPVETGARLPPNWPAEGRI